MSTQPPTYSPNYNTNMYHWWKYSAFIAFESEKIWFVYRLGIQVQQCIKDLDEYFHNNVFMKISPDNDSINKMLFIKSVNTELLQATMELEKLCYMWLCKCWKTNCFGALQNEPLSQQATCCLCHHVKRCILCCYIRNLFKKRQDFFS